MATLRMSVNAHDTATFVSVGAVWRRVALRRVSPWTSGDAVGSNDALRSGTEVSIKHCELQGGACVGGGVRRLGSPKIGNTEWID